MGLRAHFLHHHVWYNMIVVEEVKLPQPQCTWCDMLMPWAPLNGLHPKNYQQEKGAERKRHSLVVEEVRASTELDLRAYGRPLTLVS